MTIAEIGKKIAALTPPLEITGHHAGEESEFSSALFAIAETLRENGASGIVFHEGTGSDVPGLPALTFRHPGRGTVNYMAVPADRELDPFREMLLWRLEKQDGVTKDLLNDLNRLDRPVSITVFIAATCPHCPNAVRAANRLALCASNITVTIIDVEQFPALAECFHVRTVPMTVIDDELLLDEVASPENLASAVMSKNSPAYLENVLLSHVSTGNIDLATRLLLDAPNAVTAYLDVWRRSSLSSRMGLMLIAAQALAEKQNLLDAIVPGLIAELQASDDSLKGDTADLLGQIGHPDARQPLEALKHDGNPDIVEIAEDALENLETNRN